jgi:hypothetical protein
MQAFPIIPLLQDIGQLDPNDVAKDAELTLRYCQVAATAAPKITALLIAIRAQSQSMGKKTDQQIIKSLIDQLEPLLVNVPASTPTSK